MKTFLQPGCVALLSRTCPKLRTSALKTIWNGVERARWRPYWMMQQCNGMLARFSVRYIANVVLARAWTSRYVFFLARLVFTICLQFAASVVKNNSQTQCQSGNFATPLDSESPAFKNTHCSMQYEGTTSAQQRKENIPSAIALALPTSSSSCQANSRVC